MAKRIIKELLQDGDVQYRVEKQVGFTKNWVTDTITVDVAWDSQQTYSAVFDTLEEAKKFCGIKCNPVISREEVCIIP